MRIYWSDFTDVVLFGTRSQRKSSAWVAGATGGVMVPLTTNRCLVSSFVTLVSPPAGVRFLFDTATDQNVLVPDAVINFINTQLGTTIPLGVVTWRQLIKRLFRQDGQSMGQNIADAQVVFGTGDAIIDVS